MFGIGMSELIILFVIIAIPAVILFLVNHSKKNRHPPRDEDSQNAGQTNIGIGGWLILPAIGLILGPVIGIVTLIASLGMYTNVAQAGYGGIFTLELLVSAGLLIFTIYAAILFFKKKTRAPRTIITLLIVSLISTCILLAIELVAEAEPFAIESVKQLVRNIIGAAIWIPYFRKSVRVKATFIH